MFHGARGAVCSRACPLAWSGGTDGPALFNVPRRLRRGPRDASNVSRHCGKSKVSRLQSERVAFCRHCRTTSDKRPESAGFW